LPYEAKAILSFLAILPLVEHDWLKWSFEKYKTE